MLVGASTVQIGTSVMHYGFRIIDDLIDGMSGYLRSKGMHSPSELVGRSLPRIGDWGQLDQEFRLLAHIDEERCIHCNVCYTACNDGAHQAIRVEGRNAAEGQRVYIEFAPRTLHKCPAFIPGDDWTRYGFFDPGRTVAAALFFAVPPRGSFGNSGRNILDGPSYQSVNVSRSMPTRLLIVLIRAMPSAFAALAARAGYRMSVMFGVSLTSTGISAFSITHSVIIWQ